MVFGINDGESSELASSFVKNFGLTYPVLHDADRTVYFHYNVGGISPYPRDVIVDQNGIISYIHSEYDPQVMIRTIDELLGLTSVEDEKREIIPSKFRLEAFPNPFNAQTTIRFTVQGRAPVILELFDLRGGLLQSEVLGPFKSGQEFEHRLDFQNSASGIYYLRSRSGRLAKALKLVLVK